MKDSITHGEFLEIIINAFDSYQQWLDIELEKHVRLNAVPKLKGELTKGKMTWRGLRCCTNNYSGETWIEQRGERITPKLSKDVYHKSNRQK